MALYFKNSTIRMKTLNFVYNYTNFVPISVINNMTVLDQIVIWSDSW